MFWPFRRRPQPALPSSDGSDDDSLIERARQGDAAAFGELYERYLSSVYRYIAYRTARQDVAEDLTAEVFLNAWKAIERYTRRGYTFRAWLLRIAHNEVIDHYRTHRKESTLSEEDLQIPSFAGPDLFAELRADHIALARAVRRLPEQWQQLILLRFVEELSFEEIGIILGKRSGACRLMQHRALARLRELLAGEEARREF